MPITSYLRDRCESTCELCQSSSELDTYIVPPRKGEEIDEQVALCNTCLTSVNGTLDVNHLRCLNEAIWSEIPAVKVMSYRLLQQLGSEGWAQDLLGMLYLDDEAQEWADNQVHAIEHIDSNGHILSNGDSVTLIQDLNVKGAGFTAKRGTAVRRIRLVPDNAEHIEGKVDGQHIVILTKYVKKSS